MAEPKPTAADSLPASLVLPPQPSLLQLQTHMEAQCAHFGWDTNTNEEVFLLFVEEVGELAKAMRRKLKLQIEQGDPTKPIYDDVQVADNLRQEFGDVLTYLLDLSNRFGIDIAGAYDFNFQRNLRRRWK